MALLERQRDDRHSHLHMRGRDAIRASAPNIRRPSVWNAPSVICSGWRLPAHRTRGPGSISASGMFGIRSATGDPRKNRALRFPAGRRRRPAPNSRRPGACRHHRAGTFPLHRQWRACGAAGATARLCAQGHRVADDRAPRSTRPRNSPRAPPATARSLMPSPLRRPPKPRCSRGRRRARSTCAR